MTRLARISARIAAAIGCSLVVGVAYADAITPVLPVDKFERNFGEFRFVVGGSDEWPALYQGSKRVATYPGFHAQEVFASTDRQYFVAVSNLGYSKYAFAILNRDGTVLYSKPHDTGELHYCQESVSNLRYWLNPETANVRFEYGRDATGQLVNESLKSVEVRGCDGKNVVLWQR
ncbi:MAG TPA: hypothetical protein VHL05_06165 [Terriglobales bacterium]|jgi:hypothetical protein|nr:hypothetical protein [Terriglobales bacterium]